MEASALRAPAGLSRKPAPILLRLRSDEQLVALFRAGNEDAFSVIHERYRARLLAYARQMLAGARSDAEDALQDVFIRAYNALRQDDRPVTLRAWLYRVAHNRCIDQLRKPVQNDVELFENVVSPDDLAAHVQRREDLRRLVEDVRRLPEQQRSALLMREMEGLSYQELADALMVTVPAVKSLLVRARVGLVEAQTARDTACREIRDDLMNAHDRGVRASGRARRHLRECSGCRDYRSGLKGLEQQLSALAPATPPWATLLKVFGIGGSGAAAGGSAAVGGGSAVATGAAAVTTAKVAAVVCCAAVLGGGAVEVGRTHRAVDPSIASPATVAKNLRSSSPVAPQPVAARFHDATASTTASVAASHAAAKKKRTPSSTRAAMTAPLIAVPTAPTNADAGTGAADAADEETLSAEEAAGGSLAPDEDVDAPATTDGTASSGSATGSDTTTTAGSGPTTGSGSGSGSGDTSTSGSSSTQPAEPTATGATNTTPAVTPGTGAAPAAGSGGSSAPPGS